MANSEARLLKQLWRAVRGGDAGRRRFEPDSDASRTPTATARASARHATDLSRSKEYLVHVAVLGGDATILVLLLESGDPPVDSPAVTRHGSYHEYTPLTLAASRNDVYMMEVLLAHGAQVTLGYRWRLLTVTAVHSSIDAVRILLEHGVDTEIPGGWHGDLSLVYVVRCSEENAEILRPLLEYRAQSDALNGRRKSALYVAASLPNLEATAVLIAFGADVNARDAMGRVVIHGTVDDAVDRVLIVEGADVDAADGEGNTTLHRTALSSDTRILTTLLAHGASALIQDKHGLTPLWYAARYGKGEAARASRRRRDEAVTQDREEVVTVILEKMKGANDGRANLDLAFHKALLTTARGCKWTIARLLGQASSSFESRDVDGKTLLSHAVKCGDIVFIKLLLECGAGMDTAEFDERTLLHLSTDRHLASGG